MTSLARTASAVLAWFACGAAHELAHLIAACFLGCGTVVFLRENIWHALVSRRVQVTVDAQHWRACAIRASGLVISVAVALVCWRVPGETFQVVRVVATMTAAEALWTDLLGMEQKAPIDAVCCLRFSVAAWRKEAPDGVDFGDFGLDARPRAHPAGQHGPCAEVRKAAGLTFSRLHFGGFAPRAWRVSASRLGKNRDFFRHSTCAFGSAF